MTSRIIIKRRVKRRFLLAMLRVARSLGAFNAARWLTRKDLRILCYHGAALNDEHEFRGGLFISPGVFRQRLRYLAQARYPVLELDQALERLGTDKLPDSSTVITIDDGWVGTAFAMAPALHEHGFPATLYVATYYMDKQTQVFHIAIDYVLWSVAPRLIDLGNLVPNLEGVYDTSSTLEREAASTAIASYAAQLPDANARQDLLRRICAKLGLSAKHLEDSRAISFMNRDEAKSIQALGINLQLHTHRHRFPAENFTLAKQEIEDNKSCLNSIAKNQLRHFCYPSGNYEQHQIEWLRKMGIVSATTTKSGFNRRMTSHFELQRFLDSERISDIEFEAEMSGFFEIIRRCGYKI